jgi:hypothetical protein
MERDDNAMNTITLKLRATFAALCLVACSPSLGDGTDSSDETGATPTGSDPTGESNTDANPTTSGGPSGACGAGGNECPDGQFCFNGFCELGCNSNGDCADDQYCATDGDRLCHNKEATTCPDVPCEDGQVCVNGFCSTPPPDTQCMPALVDDGCESNAVCLLVSETKAECYTLPYCSEDGTCPTGTEGAVCNDGLLTDKEKICLIGFCTETSHCPANWKCFKPSPTDVVGECSSGAPLDPCLTNEDCQSNQCDFPFPDDIGWCA